MVSLSLGHKHIHKHTQLLFFFFLIIIMLKANGTINWYCRVRSKVCSQCSHSATDSGGVRWASKIHGGSAQQLPYVPNYQYTFELWKLSSNSCQSQAAQSARLWWLCRQQWVTLGTVAKIFLQLHSSKASNAPYNLVFPVRVTGCSTCQLLCLNIFSFFHFHFYLTF